MKLCSRSLGDKPSAVVNVDSGASLLVVPDHFGTLELSDAPGKYLSAHTDTLVLGLFSTNDVAVCSRTSLSSPIFLWPSEKLIEGLKSPDTSSLMLPDLLSLSDPFSGSVEESVKGVCVRVSI